MHQGLPFLIHNGFELQDMDFWPTESGALSFLESIGDLSLPYLPSEAFGEREQENSEC